MARIGLTLSCLALMMLLLVSGCGGGGSSDDGVDSVSWPSWALGTWYLDADVYTFAGDGRITVTYLDEGRLVTSTWRLIAVSGSDYVTRSDADQAVFTVRFLGHTDTTLTLYDPSRGETAILRSTR